ncbi:LamG-like jellyroll fold domain-containing protein [Niabella sp. CJ426]|uniref:LamG-like jellyroll fold domain-containing protein n=1 Tax=Niabella sp. CJ426 TaxID=3393740 RepID=UPI003D036A9E
MKHTFPIVLIALVTINIVVTISSCKKYTDPPPYFEEDSTAAPVGKRKVLLIGIDGLPGKIYRELKPANMMALQQNGKFTLSGIADNEKTTAAAGWKTLMSGVSYSTHQVGDSTFESSIQPEEGVTGKNYPSLFYFIIRSARPDLQSRFITSWPDLLTLLVPEASNKIATKNDKATKDSVLDALKNKSDDIVVAHFGSPAAAGKAGQFSAADAVYKAAIQTVDGYIGEILTMLKSRSGYNTTEDWLVVITGTHGGKDNYFGGVTDEETQIPTIYYNEKFAPIEFKRPDFSNPLFGTGQADAYGTVVNDNGLYNFGNTGDGGYTVEMKAYFPGSGTNYPSLLSKRERFSTGVVGWTLFLEGDYWQVNFGQAEQNNYQVAGSSIRDGKWHTLSFVIKDDGSSRKVRTYTDGNFNKEGDITSKGNISSPAPLTLGYLNTEPVSVKFNAADIRIFNAALSDDEVKSSACLNDISKHPQYSHLIGYWKCDDGIGASLKNQATNAAGLNFKLRNSFEWNEVSVLPCNITPSQPSGNNINLQLGNSGIAKSLFYWLRIGVPNSWGLEGSYWLQNYETEFLGVN